MTDEALDRTVNIISAKPRRVSLCGLSLKAESGSWYFHWDPVGTGGYSTDARFWFG